MTKVEPNEPRKNQEVDDLENPLVGFRRACRIHKLLNKEIEQEGVKKLKSKLKARKIPANHFIIDFM